MARKGPEQPTRRIGRLHSSVGAHVRTEDRATIIAESSLEHQWIAVLEYDRGVRELSSQSVQIDHMVAGRPRSTHPDIKAVFQLGEGHTETVIYEVKPEAMLRRNWPELKPKFRAATNHCRQRGWRFKLVTDRLIETPYVKNAMFLREYRRYRDDPEVAPLGQLIANALAAEGESTPRALLDLLFQDSMQQAKALPALWMLMATGHISVDMVRPLGWESSIRTAEPAVGGGRRGPSQWLRPEQIAKASAAYAAQTGWVAVHGRPSATPSRSLAAPQPFMSFEPGRLVDFEGRGYRITAHIAVDSVLAEDLEDKSVRRLKVHDLTSWVAPQAQDLPDGESEVKDRDLRTYSKEEWAVAKERLRIIKPLLANPRRSRSEVMEAAKAAGKGIATVYRWLRMYEESGRLSTLVPERRGRVPGTTYLSRTQEAIITTAIEDKYTGKRGSAQAVIEAVAIACRNANQPVPNPQSVHERINALHPRDKLKAQGRHDLARNLFSAIKGQYPGATFPLAVVQIDHTPLDLVVVDPVYRKPIGRPCLTLAIDVYSRMVCGLYLALEAPSSTSVGMCLANAVNAKDAYTEALGVPGSWPVWGKPALLHSDNGPDFRSKAVAHACEQHGIDHKFRPVRQPQYGGHIERLMGTMATEIRKAPGATYSSVAEKQGHDPEATAALTLKEAERRVVEWIVNVYHAKVHSEINMPPISMWTRGIVGTREQPGRGILPLPRDPERFALDFLPSWERTVQPYGILLDHIFYYDRALDHWINARDPQSSRDKRKFIVRRDPRDISKVYFFDPDRKALLTVNYRNMGRPAMSEWELRAALKILKDEGRQQVDEEQVFGALERMRKADELAVERSKGARRMAARNPAQGMPAKVAAVAPSQGLPSPDDRPPQTFEEWLQRGDEDESNQGKLNPLDVQQSEPQLPTSGPEVILPFEEYE